MTANQFRLFIAAVIVLGGIGWFAWQGMQRSARIKDCLESIYDYKSNEPYYRQRCEAAERGGRLTR